MNKFIGEKNVMKNDQDIESSILKIIHDTKWLMERDNLMDLGEREEEIVKIVSSFIEEQVRCSRPILEDSTFEKEKEKMTCALVRYFREDEIQSRYHEKILPLFWQTAGKEYVTQFRGDQYLWEILIPFSLNEISHIYMGHEVIHALTLDHHYEEWKNLYRYSECLPMFYEFMQGADLDSKSRAKILSFRMVDLLKMYQTLKDPITCSILKNDKDQMHYYTVTSKSYLVSFYYVCLLYNLYLEDRGKVKDQFLQVLKQKTTTEHLLDHFGLLNDPNPTSFEKGYRLLYPRSKNKN